MLERNWIYTEENPYYSKDEEKAGCILSTIVYVASFGKKELVYTVEHHGLVPTGSIDSEGKQMVNTPTHLVMKSGRTVGFDNSKPVVTNIELRDRS